MGIGMRLTKGPLPGGRRSLERPEAVAASAGAVAGSKLAKPAGRAPHRTVDTARLGKVVARIQDVVAEPDAWSSIIEEISIAAGAQCVQLFRAPSSDTPDVALVAQSLSSEQLSERYIRGGWFRRDIRTRAIPKMLMTGVGVDQDFITPDAIKREPYYQDFLGPFGLRWWAGIAFRSADDLWCMAIQRTAAQGYFDPDEQVKLATLCQSLTQAATISQAVGRARIAGMVDALDLVAQPALVLDQFGRVLRENAAATKLYDPWFYVVGRRIVAKDREAAAALAGLAAACRQHQLLVSGGNRIVVRRGDRRPVVANSHVLSGATIEPFSGGRILLLLDDLEARPLSQDSTLICVFGLTPAEARLAAIIGAGWSLDDAGDALHVRRETARNQLKSIFAKTDTHRQAELVALLARLSTAPYQIAMLAPSSC